MIKLKDLLALFPYAAIDFSEDAFIQILDDKYTSHYRLVDGKLKVGGDFLIGRETDPNKLMDHLVTLIELNNQNQLEIYVK